MKDINLNNTKRDPDTPNDNTNEVSETVNVDINKNENIGIDSKKSTMNDTEGNNKASEEMESSEKRETETDVTKSEDGDGPSSSTDDNNVETPSTPAEPTAFVPKYKYTEDQWSPLNTSGKKCYDVGLLKQIKEAPLSKDKPDAPLLETCHVIRTAPMPEVAPFAPMLRPINDSLFPSFAKGGGSGARNTIPRDNRRNASASGKSSAKMPPPGGSSSMHKPVIRVSLSLREDVKLNESESAWKPTRFKKPTLSEEEQKDEEVFKKFRGILNKLTPQKFDTLLERVKNLEINTQKRLEGVIDLIFEKAIEEPNFSETYAAMCNKLGMIKAPANNAANPEQSVNFRALIITKCQKQFVTNTTDEQVLKLEKEFSECTDAAKKKELQLMLAEEQRRVRMRSVGNVRFIGELYKLKILKPKIMVFCMDYLIDKLEEEKLECLCKLLTTIGQQIENEPNITSHLDTIFKKLQDIVSNKSNKIPSRVKFMIQDVIELRRRKWVVKSVIDAQPKTMDQIQKEADQQQRHIELMNASPMGGGGRGRRGGDSRRSHNSMDSGWHTTKTTNFPVDTSKLKAVAQKNLSNIKLAPPQSAWNRGSATKPQAQAASSAQFGLAKNMFSVLDNLQTDPISLSDVKSGNSRSASVGVTRANSVPRNEAAVATSPPKDAKPTEASATLQQEPLPDDKMRKFVKSTIDQCVLNADNEELVQDVKLLFPPQYHAAVVAEILNVILEKSAKEVNIVTKSLVHLVSTGTIAAKNFLAGVKETCEFASDLYIDIPMLYEYLGKIMAPQIEKKHITLLDAFDVSESIIAANHGHMLLKAIISNLNESMGPTFVRSKWQESGLTLNKWMNDDKVQKFIADNKFEFLEADVSASEESNKAVSPEETRSKLLQLMNDNESCECIKGWIHDKLGKSANEDWFMKALCQAICEHALFGAEGRSVPHFNQDRMAKYATLINDFGESKESREASCLVGIQHLIHRLEHPQGLTLEIFQYLYEQYIISVEGFLAWEKSDKDPEGKGVILKALTSFFTDIKEAENEDSCSED